MHENPSSQPDRGCNLQSNEHEDTMAQSAVIALVLAEHPTQITGAELAREFCKSAEDFSERDALDRAIRDLVGGGLLRLQGDSVLPTRAALHFDRLDCQ
jgi:hypothetical protein